MPFINPISEIYYSLLDILAPRECLVCGEKINGNVGKFEFICKQCELFFPAAPSSDEILNRFFQNFRPDDVAVSHAYGLFGVKDDKDYLQIIHGLKYSGFTRVGTEFGTELGKKILDEASVEYDGVVPVPIHHAKRRERGFNQSLIIAKAVAKVLQTPVIQPVKRIRYTITQTKLSKEERKTNISNTIAPAKKGMTLEGSYLLIDDVLTTGSTVNVTAQTLLDMGASRVDCATLAIA